MAKTGVLIPMMAEYAESSGTVSYSDGKIIDYLRDVDMQIQTSENNNLYADNRIVETEKTFSGGTITINTSDLSLEDQAFILGLSLTTPTETGIAGTGVKELSFNDAAAAPYLGVAWIVSGQKDNVPYWLVFALTKVIFSIPNNTFTTRGESIEWQTPSITGQIMRDDSTLHDWHKVFGPYTTEAAAITAAKTFLNIT